MHESERQYEFSLWKNNEEMTIINSWALHYTFGTSAKNYKVPQNFREQLDEKMRSNLKLLKDKIL